ncbi:MAG: DUF4886 domain-containing protein [Clostridia bacterium]|nr:DUF4886 domain-containing protein [Clostridia bacterium]
MKTRFLQIIAMLLLLVMTLTACGGPVDPVDSDTPETTEAPTTESETANDIYIEREDKEIKNLLMIGNSGCYYYVEELYGIAAADGYELVVANLYKSGCYVEEHWKWLNDNSNSYEFYITSAKYKGNRKQVKERTIKGALDYAKSELGGDWDVITLQQNCGYAMTGDYEGLKENTMSYTKKLYDIIKEGHPDATLYWHQTWSYQVGYDADPKDTNSVYKIQSSEKCTEMHELVKKLAYEVAEENGVKVLPAGDAWEIARRNELIGNTLCARKGSNNDIGDFLHDGDIGGGQYLNACVWYEVLMGESCVGNTWRPTYELSEEKIAILQAAAHEAVAAVYGPGYAK